MKKKPFVIVKTIEHYYVAHARTEKEARELYRRDKLVAMLKVPAEYRNAKKLEANQRTIQ